jgi:hypothetical protein
MSSLAHGWVRVWLPPIFHNLGTWVIRAEESIGKPSQLITAPPCHTTIKIEGRGFVSTGPFTLSLEMSVYVEPSRVTEIHIPSYWLNQFVALSGA